MKRILSLASAALLIGTALAQGGSPAQQSLRDPIRVTAYKNARFGLRQGTLNRTLELSEIAGCTSGIYDGSDPRSRPGGGEANTRVLDLVQKGAYRYLTFQTTLNSGCNVQGLCGAGASISLVWLKLDARLRPVSRRMQILEDCIRNVTLTQANGKVLREVALDLPSLELRQGVLTLSFEAADYTSKQRTRSSLRYDRRAPEKGLQVLSQVSAL